MVSIYENEKEELKIGRKLTLYYHKSRMIYFFKMWALSVNCNKLFALFSIFRKKIVNGCFKKE